jgi:hypothetical protein
MTYPRVRCSRNTNGDKKANTEMRRPYLPGNILHREGAFYPPSGTAATAYSTMRNQDPDLADSLPDKIKDPIEEYLWEKSEGKSEQEALNTFKRVASFYFDDELLDYSNEMADHHAKLGAYGSNTDDMTPVAVDKFKRENFDRRIPKVLQDTPRIKMMTKVTDAWSGISLNPVFNWNSGNAEGQLLAISTGQGSR